MSSAASPTPAPAAEVAASAAAQPDAAAASGSPQATADAADAAKSQRAPRQPRVRAPRPPVDVSDKPPKSAIQCRFQSSKNGCRAGDACVFMHTAEGAAAGAAAAAAAAAKPAAAAANAGGRARRSPAADKSGEEAAKATTDNADAAKPAASASASAPRRKQARGAKAAPRAGAAASAAARPLVGVGVLVVDPQNHPGCILVGQRKGSHGAATFATPGGHLEYQEEWSACGVREVKEETNLDLVAPLQHVYTTNAVFPESKKHYVTLFMKGAVDANSQAQLQTMEPNKCVEWVWMTLDDIRRKQAAGELKVFNSLKPLLEDDKFVL